ncbi:MAG: serine/threonine protein kinase, partial [Deltaproteobacteria bacterium]|nr:serine/threonine protein kinase [Deltaproteobacteria bacterium]
MGQESAQLVGQILADTYRVERLLGGGGMGAVYEASHLRLRRHFAVKVLFAEVAANEEALLRFQREAQITSGLGHPNIVEVIDFNHTPDGAPYLVMELLEGRDLEAVLAREVQLPLERAMKIFGQVGAALLAAHGQGIIHRDLKPSNVFLCDVAGRNDVVKIVDFGISKVLGSKSAVTRTQATMGTPGYMSPEQAEGRAAEVDVRTDVFALGTMLFEMLAGRTPFDGETIPTMLYKIVHVAPPALRSFRADLSPAVAAVVHRAMEKKPEDRFQTVNEMLASLGEALAGTSAALPASLLDVAAKGSAPGDKPESLGAQVPRAGAMAPTPGDAMAPTVDAAAGVSETTLSSSAVEVRPVPGAAQGTRKKAGTFVAVALALVVLLGAGVGVFLLR